MDIKNNNLSACLFTDISNSNSNFIDFWLNRLKNELLGYFLGNPDRNVFILAKKIASDVGKYIYGKISCNCRITSQSEDN